MTRTIERRTLVTDFEVRSNSSTVTCEGYASTFNQKYDMYFYNEEVAQGAFTKTLSESPDVRFLLNHDGLPLARTTSGTLELSEDSKGLAFRTTLDATDPDVARIVPKMKRGDLNEMSFAFRTIKDEWNEAYTERTLRELSLKDGDVSLVTYPANPNTSAKLRAARSAASAAPILARIIEELRDGKTLSASTFAVLEKVLAALAAADVELDQTLIDISALMGVENPDHDADCQCDTCTVADDMGDMAEAPRSLSPAHRAAAMRAAASALKATKILRAS